MRKLFLDASKFVWQINKVHTGVNAGKYFLTSNHPLFIGMPTAPVAQDGLLRDVSYLESLGIFVPGTAAGLVDYTPPILSHHTIFPSKSSVGAEMQPALA